MAGERGLAARVPARLSATEGRRFGLTVGIAFAVLGGVAWWRGRVLVTGVALPVFMGIVYFAVLTPTGLLRRLAGKNSLLRPRTAKSFWVSRAADDQRRTGMEHQF